MNIQIHGNNIDLNPKQEAYIQKKLSGIEKLFQNILFAKVDVIGNTHHRKGKNITVKAELMIPKKPIIFAEEEVTTMEEGVDCVVDELKYQLKKLKEKQQKKRKRLSASL